MLRSLIRALYNASTSDQGCFARSVRAVLTFIPVDLTIEIHKVIALFMLIATILHTDMHFVNFAQKPDITWATFGLWPFLSGGALCVLMALIYSAAFPNVKNNKFELFWYSHHLFVVFFLLLLLHGRGGWNPDYWKWMIGPVFLYALERIYRVYNSRKEVVLLSVTQMRPLVMCIELDKKGVFADPYQEGQYAFINSPTITPHEWHPFTISSAPDDPTVTFHIRTMAAGSWTRRLQEYLASMGPAGATFYELNRFAAGGTIKGKITGPNDLPLLRIDGPHAAPTQHMKEYKTVAVIAGGIGVTPLAASVKSVVFHRWKYAIDNTYPSNAYFVWICNFDDMDSFRFFIRQLKEVEDEMFNMRSKNREQMADKKFEFHIFVTSAPKPGSRISIPEVASSDNSSDPQADLAFWGPRRRHHPNAVDGYGYGHSGKTGGKNGTLITAPFNEADIYRAMKTVQGKEPVELGDLRIWNGRPQWDSLFVQWILSHPHEQMGVCFCGNPLIATDLEKMCHKYSDADRDRIFHFHRENF